MCNRLIIIFVVLCLLVPCVVSANDLTCEVSQSEQYITVSGQTNGAHDVIMLITKSPLSGIPNKTDTVYANQCVNDINAGFTFQIALTAFETSKTYYIAIDASDSGSYRGTIRLLDASLSDSEKLAIDLESLSLTFNGTDTTIPLPTAVSGYNYGSVISWTTNSTGVTIKNGVAEIFRFDEKRSITLTATATLNGKSKTKEFTFEVEALEDGERVQLDANRLEYPYNGEEIEISFPKTGYFGSVLSWATDNTNIVEISGDKAIVHRELLLEDTAIKLICTIAHGGSTTTKELVIVIKKADAEFFRALDLKEVNIVYNGTDSSISLPSVGIYGSKFIWTSSDRLVVEPFRNTATINRKAITSAKTVLLTVTIEGFSLLSKDFSLTVQPERLGSSGGRGGDIVSSSTSIVTYDPIPEVPARNDVFTDLEGYTWAVSSIEELRKRGIINGISANEFVPQNAVTRAEFVKMAVLTFNMPLSEAGASFSDIQSGDWCAPYVSTAFNSGIVLGIDENTFGRDLPITRQDMAAIINRIIRLTEQSDILFIDDSDIADYTRDAVYSLKKKGIITGTDDNSFNPNSKTNRAEAAVILARCLEFVHII